ncbi:MAG: hypothetical protein ACI9XO_000106 [Paraglaciecola sp.]|jgi:hypothetical protein
MKNSKYLFLAILASSLFFTACDDDDNVQMNEEELITTVELTFTENGNVTTFAFRDTDGDGGNPPVIDPIQLTSGTAYSIAVRFLDESNSSDIEDITVEVQEESDEHLVCFSTTGNLEDVTINDTDSAGNPLGLIADLTAGQAGNGTLTVVLKHQPDKALTNPCSTGETDVEVTFEVEIQ